MNYTKILTSTGFEYKYNLSELKEWLKRGREHGDVGMIITKFDGKFMTYKGFGTIEHPSKDLQTFTQVYLPIFDDCVVPKEPILSYSYRFIDFTHNQK